MCSIGTTSVPARYSVESASCSSVDGREKVARSIIPGVRCRLRRWPLPYFTTSPGHVEVLRGTTVHYHHSVAVGTINARASGIDRQRRIRPCPSAPRILGAHHALQSLPDCPSKTTSRSGAVSKKLDIRTPDPDGPLAQLPRARRRRRVESVDRQTWEASGVCLLSTFRQVHWQEGWSDQSSQPCSRSFLIKSCPAKLSQYRSYPPRLPQVPRYTVEAVVEGQGRCRRLLCSLCWLCWHWAWPGLAGWPRMPGQESAMSAN